MLAVHYQQARGFLLVIRTDNAGIIGKSVLPKQQVTHRIALVHGVEQISHFGTFPDKWALNVGQADVAHFDILDQRIQVLIHLLKNGFAHDLPSRANVPLSCSQGGAAVAPARAVTPKVAA